MTSQVYIPSLSPRSQSLQMNSAITPKRPHDQPCSVNCGFLTLNVKCREFFHYCYCDYSLIIVKHISVRHDMLVYRSEIDKTETESQYNINRSQPKLKPNRPKEQPIES